MRSRHPRLEHCEPALMSIEGAFESFGNGEEVRFALSLLGPGIKGGLSKDQERRLLAVKLPVSREEAPEPLEPSSVFRR